MRIDQLFYLIDIAKTNSISTTAHRVYSSQQAISEAIRKMEKELGTTLLNRSKTGVSLTSDGQIVVEHALEIMSKYQEMLDRLEAGKKTLEPVIDGNLVICVSPVIANTIMPEVVYQYNKQFPNVKITLKEVDSFGLVNLMVTENCHIGILSAYQSSNRFDEVFNEPLPDHLEAELLFADSLVACVSRNSDLALRKSITMDELSENYKQTMYANAEYQAEDFDVLFVSNNTDLHKRFILQELAVCQMPSYAYYSVFKSKEFAAVPVKDPYFVNTYILKNKAMPTPAAEKFLLILKAVCDHLMEEWVHNTKI